MVSQARFVVAGAGRARRRGHPARRIVAVCDAYRAMVEPRPYRGPLGHDGALAELRKHSGTQFDARCVAALQAALASRAAEQHLTLRRPD